MDRAIVLDHLAQAERHAASGKTLIDRQRAIIAELERDGHHTALAQKTLATFLRTQALYVSEVERIRRELAAAS